MPKLGSQLYLAIDAGPIHDEAGNLSAVVETLRDLTDQKRAEMALKELATKDGLTGLSNRHAFDQMLMTEWARAQRTQKPLALLFVDVDHFKLFNDRHGHQTGDECLRAVANVVSRHAVRPLDLASRYGGEEFALILPDLSCDDACAIAESAVPSWPCGSPMAPLGPATTSPSASASPTISRAKPTAAPTGC